MANWTLEQATDKVKFFLRPLNPQFYKDNEGTDQPIWDLINEGIGDMCVKKAPYVLWDNHEAPCVCDTLLTLDDEMLSIKRVERITSLDDPQPVLLRRPEDYDIHDPFLEFVEAQTGIIRILATRRPDLLEELADVMPFGSPFQLGIVYYAVAALSLAAGTPGVTVSAQYLAYYDRIKVLWEQQTNNEAVYLRGQSFNPDNVYIPEKQTNL
jgi:hypothetical protein